MKNSSFDELVKRVIRSNFNMISSSADHQESEETYNASVFELPNPNGKTGGEALGNGITNGCRTRRKKQLTHSLKSTGACTSALLQALYDNGDGASWVETLQQMRSVLKGMGYHQIPQLTSSRLIDVHKPLQIVPPGSGRRRALLIGINYVGQQGQLTACHNDVMNIREVLTEVYGFSESEMVSSCLCEREFFSIVVSYLTQAKPCFFASALSFFHWTADSL